jgi:hypothetical protein
LAVTEREKTVTRRIATAADALRGMSLTRAHVWRNVLASDAPTMRS